MGLFLPVVHMDEKIHKGFLEKGVIVLIAGHIVQYVGNDPGSLGRIKHALLQLL